MPSSDPILASVDLWPVTWAPVGWALCNGQELAVQQNTALFSLIGTAYGGNGTTKFNVPDLRGRVPVGMGQQPGGSLYQLGNVGGTETVLLTAPQAPLAAHTHPATYTDPAFSAAATGTVTPKAKTGLGTYVSTPENNFMAPSSPNNIYSSSANKSMGAADVTITVTLTKSSAGSVSVGQNPPVSASQAHENRMPYQVLNYIIALTGIYPSRQ